MSVDFEALVCQTQIEPNSTQRTSLRNVVKNIITDRETLKNMFNQTFGVFDSVKGTLLSNLKDLKEYQDGFDKSDGWYWRPTTWNLANNKLKECVTIWGNFIERQDFTDKDEEQALSLRFTGDVLFDVQSPFQRVRILESYKYGKMLALDDMVMTTEKDEFHYHEMISHPALFSLPNAKDSACQRF